MELHEKLEGIESKDALVRVLSGWCCFHDSFKEFLCIWFEDVTRAELDAPRKLPEIAT
jgi:hypothetical protein